MSAGSAEYDTYRKNLSLTKGYIITGNDGQRVSGQGAVWDSSTQVLHSVGHVDFETRWGKLSATDMCVDLKSKELTMHNGHGVINLGAVEN